MENLGPDGDHWLVQPLDDEDEWTQHFGRQLGMQATHGVGGIHETLLLMLREVDELINNWPPSHDISVCKELAHAATKHLSPIELYATLLAGPPQWRRMKIESECRIDRLAKHMQPLLEKALAAELNRVLGKWVTWDIRKLRERRNEALDAAKAAEARAEAEAAVPRVPYRRPDGRDRVERLRPLYQPRGRT